VNIDSFASRSLIFRSPYPRCPKIHRHARWFSNSLLASINPDYPTVIMSSITISDLPNEVIQQILLSIPPLSIVNFQQVSRRFNTLVEPLLWKQKCQTIYRYWSPRHQIREKYLANANSHDWQSVIAQRHKVDRITTATLNSILESQTGRIDKFQCIVDCGYDAKDCLLRHMKCDDDAEDVLARR